MQVLSRVTCYRQIMKRKINFTIAVWFLTSPSCVGDQGGYCQPGAQVASPCPEGTYNNRTNARTSSECSDCPGGYYCQGSNNIEPTDQCTAGFYCVSGAKISVRAV